MKSTVAIIMGSKSDWPTMKSAAEILDEFQVSYSKQVVSAHRTPDKMFEFAKSAADKGIKSSLPAQAEQRTYLEWSPP